MPLLRSFQGRLSVIPPAEDHSSFRNVTVGDFVPAHHYASLAPQIFIHLIHEPALEFLFIVKILLVYPFLAVRTFLPMGLPRLVSAKMYVFRREKSAHLVHHILKKGKHIIVSRTIYYIGLISAKSGEHAYIFIHHRTSILGIGSKGGIGMCRHIYLRYHIYLSVCRIGHNLTDIILSVVAADRSGLPPDRVLPVRERSLTSVCPPCPYRGQAGIFPDLEAPPVVVRKVEVEVVELEHGHAVYDFQKVLLRQEISRNVHHQSPILEPWSIVHHHRRHRPPGIRDKDIRFDG